VVAIRNHCGTRKQIGAYVVARANANPSKGAAESPLLARAKCPALTQFLPHIEMLSRDELPLTKNGKVDRCGARLSKAARQKRGRSSLRTGPAKTPTRGRNWWKSGKEVPLVRDADRRRAELFRDWGGHFADGHTNESREYCCACSSGSWPFGFDSFAAPTIAEDWPQ
jgi:hypothetical protein